MVKKMVPINARVVREELNRAGLTVAQAAAKIGIHPTTLHKVLKTGEASESILFSVSALLGCPKERLAVEEQPTEASANELILEELREIAETQRRLLGEIINLRKAMTE